MLKHYFILLCSQARAQGRLRKRLITVPAQESSILYTIFSFEPHIHLTVSSEYCSTAINDQQNPAPRLFCSFNKSNHHYHLLSPHCLPGNLLSISLTLCYLSLTTTQCSHYTKGEERLKMGNTIKSKSWIHG